MTEVQNNSLPGATYRLQFNREFTFRQAADATAYLHELGITHIYASPYLKARPGSQHGYDIVDHNALNPDIGTENDYELFVSALKKYGMGQVLDIVPNHMAVMGSDNAWWLDVLENGPSSAYACYFDIDWQPVKTELRGKILLPVLSNHYGKVLQDGELILDFNAEAAKFSLHYHEHLFPVDPKEYPQILLYREPELEKLFEDKTDVYKRYRELCNDFANLPHRNETQATAVKHRKKQIAQLRQQLTALCGLYPALKGFILENVNLVNGQKDSPDSFKQLHHLLETQGYRLAYWRVAGDEINYRRFFDINNLAGIRVEEPRVFDATHEYILKLLAAGHIQGLRVDHIDGLYDPLQYLRRLSDKISKLLSMDSVSGQSLDFYLVVEKIAASYEHLSTTWPVAGTTGYEFANMVNGLFVNSDAAKQMRTIYHTFIRRARNFDEMVYQAKKHIQSVPLASELHMLAIELNRISESNPATRDYTLNALRNALREIIACFPVYRTYICKGNISEQDIHYIQWAVAQARKRSRAADRTVFDFILSVLLTETGAENSDDSRLPKRHFTMKLQQYTAPVMAKGYEDTALYNYHCLVSLNEVGGDPRRFGTSTNAFHYLNKERQNQWPHTMLCLSTHDNKRSADVRARINVLAEIPQRWHAQVVRWSHLNRSRKKKVNGQLAPSRNDEYLLYQTLIGTWPVQPEAATGNAVMENYLSRIQSYMRKAIREAKQTSSWNNPNIDYEQALSNFINAIFSGTHHNPFLEEITQFIRDILPAGLLNALSQYQLLLTAPGMPDIYQGNELWDFSLVDPDNRHPVDLAVHAGLLVRLKQFLDVPENEYPARTEALLRTMEDGRIKLYLIWKLLNFRRNHRYLFDNGSYVPLESGGAHDNRIIAFARACEERMVIVVAPRLLYGLIDKVHPSPMAETWGDTRVKVPYPHIEKYYNVLTCQTVNVERQNGSSWLPVRDVLATFPTALLAATN